MHADESDSANEARPRPSRARVAFGVFLAVAALLLILEHRAHALDYWPFLLLGACLVMHLFMHRGHGKGGGHGH